MRLFLLLTAFLCFAGQALAADPVTLRVRTEIDRQAIRLADVFDHLPEGLDRDIAIAPLPGKSVTYDVHVLSNLAQRYRLDWKPQSMTDKTLIIRASTQITMEMIETKVMEKIKPTLKDEKESVELVFDNRNLQIYLPATLEPDFSLMNFSYDETSHRFRSELVARTDERPINQPITGRVVIKKSVPVLIRRLSAGTTVTPSDITYITLNEDQIGNDVLTDEVEIIGQELRRDEQEGDVLRAHDVIPPRLVTRGALVMIKIQTPTMLITTQGKALQDGTKGDVVRILNVQSNRVVEGTVEATGVVRIGPFLRMAAG
ncbi:MAG: flagellar basal body P-ring formation chaperone FlgA [Bdellovibrionales bacterium]